MEIKITNLSHVYMPKTPFEHQALTNINLHITSGMFVAFIGHTGSGKSTIVQHINGLLKPTSGVVQIGDTVIEASKKNKKLKELRRAVGMVFQYPEHQLFDETVEKDIAFGPMNFGFTREEAYQKAKEVLPLVDLTEDILQKSPFDLSGGQKRRVAIAGVLASKPRVLILDEPTAGLDPVGRKKMMELFLSIHQQEKLTTILVTHNMEFAAMYADLVVVMDKGQVLRQGTPEEVFKSLHELQEIGLDVPETVQLARLLEERFKSKLPQNLFTKDKLVEAIVPLVNKEVD
ncbi:energy-coupling factor ABC transporter ATP-binding protein [Anaerobacillus alkaliphilus]|uniref:Energy-coupling factor transporter ATP-binding protein EcfA2 n=1 Tax=Anaerobacillus alkaliphilus TaxID=1548597 RepID=A0A4Q0VYS2_9BACI|nr:energy-coupling factor ABC transporter ATP-binding protein [Anaerobacillus alkaliphilus]RXJ03069.1 energy-coupling factor ABC transporter ATP-binding protein [Anaerobacillus alkaliphilus]